MGSGDRADVHLAVAERASDDSPDAPEPAPALVVIRIYDRTADDEAITTEIDAMEHDPTGTVPRLLDIATLPDGRACVVVERIDGRSLASMLDVADFSPGQVVTALAPLVVATRDLRRRGLVHARLAPSDVLIDATGRPRLIGLGALERIGERTAASQRTERAQRAHAALLALMETVVAASREPTRFVPAIDLARRMLDERPFTPDHERIERALFAVADPTPLILPIRPSNGGTLPSRVIPVRSPGVPEPSEHTDVPTHPLAAGGEPAAVRSAAPGERDAHRSAARRLAELAQLPGLGDVLAEGVEGGLGSATRRRLAAWARPRRAVLATGGFAGAGALVLLLTAVPPAATEARGPDLPEPSSVEAAPATTSTMGASAAAGAVAPAPTDARAGADDGGATGTAQSDPLEAAASLLEIRAGCLVGRDLACVASYAQPGGPIEARDLAAIASHESVAPTTTDLSAISVTAELGDAVVVSVPRTGGREPASLLMVRSEAGWRLREWFD
ncbi:hypothetical protein [Agromyces sp. M3QZ16-3]|uniref:hypothetical protein n=1 Tax=Agromyces sp. M3QZ16-3 TaxID=3447585 RepID=UPI003F693F2F